MTNKQKLVLAGAAGVMLLLLFGKKKPTTMAMSMAMDNIPQNQAAVADGVTITTPSGQVFQKQGDIFIQMKP